MLNTAVGTLKLSTPLLLASGYITETPEFFLNARPYGCAGMVTRSLKEHVPPERARIPAPRYAIYGQRSMLNCEWGNERPWTDWFSSNVRQVAATGSPIIISLSGREPESCRTLMRAFDKVGVDAYEINISCSHSGALHGNLNVDVEHLRHVMQMLRPVTKTPLWVKLSYSSFLAQMAVVAEEGGADAIVCTNSIGPGLLIDTKSGTAKLGIKGGGGGLTGEAIFPIALRCVSQLSQTVAVPIVGCGGISTADHVVQMLMAGASAVQLYTAPALEGPTVFRRLRRGLTRFLSDHREYGCVRDVIGVFNKRSAGDHRFTAPRPVLTEERCTGCGICLRACAFGALDTVAAPRGESRVAINGRCISCNACVGVCPPKFGAIEARYAGDDRG